MNIQPKTPNKGGSKVGKVKGSDRDGKKSRINFKIDDAIYERFRKMSSETGRTMTFMLVQCVKDRVEAWEQEQKGAK